MQIQALSKGDMMWNVVADYAQQCSWRAGASLARQMKEEHFTDWERVFVAFDDEDIAGYCTFAKTDCLPDVGHTPYIGFLFVDERYRGNRLSEQLIISALAYGKELGYDKVYLVSDHVNLYEKYGFIKIDEKVAPWGKLQSIFMHVT